MKTLENTIYLFTVTTIGAKDYFYPLRRVYLNRADAESMVLRMNLTRSTKNDIGSNWYRLLSDKALRKEELLFLN